MSRCDVELQYKLYILDFLRESFDEFIDSEVISLEEFIDMQNKQIEGKKQSLLNPPVSVR